MKVIATTALDLLTHPELIEKAKQEHKETLHGKQYQSAIPVDVLPR